MKILYGVVGEGMGHAMRSGVVLQHLASAGHDLRVAVSGRAAAYLSERHPGRVIEIAGLTMTYEENVVKKWKTALANLKAARDLPDNARAYVRLRREFDPDLVISDFESWSYFFARTSQIPVISVDNMQVIARCHHDREVLGDDFGSFLLAKGIVKSKLPSANAYLITTFFYPRVKKPRTTLHPPILRPQVLAAKQTQRWDEHVLVYQSAAGNQELLSTLKSIDASFKVYGARRDLTSELVEDNVTLCPFSEEGFIDDLASARAVITGGGFTLLGEALYLGKPVLSIPLEGQFEQVLNANYLQALGYGASEPTISRPGIERFLERLDAYREAVAQFEHDQNRGLMSQLDSAMVEAVNEGALL